MYGAFYFPSELTFVDITNAFIRRSRKLDLGNWFLYHAGSYIVLVLTSCCFLHRAVSYIVLVLTSCWFLHLTRLSKSVLQVQNIKTPVPARSLFHLICITGKYCLIRPG